MCDDDFLIVPNLWVMTSFKHQYCKRDVITEGCKELTVGTCDFLMESPGQAKELFFKVLMVVKYILA